MSPEQFNQLPWTGWQYIRYCVAIVQAWNQNCTDRPQVSIPLYLVEGARFPVIEWHAHQHIWARAQFRDSGDLWRERAKFNGRVSCFGSNTQTSLQWALLECGPSLVYKTWLQHQGIAHSGFAIPAYNFWFNLPVLTLDHRLQAFIASYPYSEVIAPAYQEAGMACLLANEYTKADELIVEGIEVGLDRATS